MADRASHGGLAGGISGRERINIKGIFSEKEYSRKGEQCDMIGSLLKHLVQIYKSLPETWYNGYNGVALASCRLFKVFSEQSVILFLPFSLASISSPSASALMSSSSHPAAKSYIQSFFNLF